MAIMIRRQLSPLCVVIAFSALLGPAQGQQQKRTSSSEMAELQAAVDRLVQKEDPAQDDWLTEAKQSAMGQQLRALAGLMDLNGLTQPNFSLLAVEGARSTPLRPTTLTKRMLPGGITVLKSPAELQSKRSMLLDRAILELATPFMHAAECRFYFKIVGITAESESRWTVQVRYEAFAHVTKAPPKGAAGLIQQTATWRMTWVEQPDKDRPIIEAIDLIDFEELATKTRLFTEVTGSVLGESSGWREHLQRGAEHWYGKLDTAGGLYFMGHHGLAIGDVNGDGLEDLYVALGNGLPNKLLVQNPDGTLHDVAAEAGVAWLDDTKGVLFADMDNDGDQDLLCAIGRAIVLCKNDGKGKFGPFISMRAATPAVFYSLAVADYDLDGDLDVYGCRYVKVRYGVSIPIPFHDANNGPTNHLMRNDGHDRYVDVTSAVGLDVNNTRFSLAASWADYDNDGDPDLYVANDFGRNNLYRNDNGKFIDVAAEVGAEDQAAGMGVSWSDFDLDGDLDLHVTNMFSSAGQRIAYQSRFQEKASADQRSQIQRHSIGNTLLANQGDGTFKDVSERAGIRMGRWAWGASFVDLNNDGLDDLVVPNGFLTNEKADDL